MIAAPRLEWGLEPWQRPDGRWTVRGAVLAHQLDGHTDTYIHCFDVYPFATEAEAQEFIDDLRATHGGGEEAEHAG